MEAVVGNLGEALESARLYENTQKRAERERLAADVSSSIRENLEVDAVLRTAVVQIRQALNLANVEVRLEASGLVDQARTGDQLSMAGVKDGLLEGETGTDRAGTEGGNGKNSEPEGRLE
jgi:GAF domain-containing protein